MKLVSFLLAGLVAVPSSVTLAQRPERGRDLGIPFEGTPGPLDAITDVGGIEVGHRTLVEGNGKLVVGKGPVRTGVTAIFPRGKDSDDPVFAGWFTMNGNGEMTGTTWVEESGFLWGPVMITNTHSVGVVRDAVIEWVIRRGRMRGDEWSLPVVAETWDGEAGCLGRDGQCPRRFRHGGQRRRGHGNGVQPVQGRDRHGVAPARPA